MGADFRPVDFRNRAAMVAACQGVDKVVHAGALARALGDYKDFYETNVSGTENVIAGCRVHGVNRLVYISSCSVLARPKPQFHLDESYPFPREYLSFYAETKALAEQRVNKAYEEGLSTVILRPRAIYGPGDKALFPRLADAVVKGRMPLLGDGETLTNITHVSDVVQAILLALDAEKANGKTYMITGNEDVNLWEIIRLVADKLGASPLHKRISVKKAMAIGGAMESLWQLLNLRREPPLTRYKVGMFGYSQTHDISHACEDLGYEPKVHWREGVLQFLESLSAPEKETLPGVATVQEKESPSVPVPVKFTLMQVGVTRAQERLFGLSNSWRKVDIPALIALIEHSRYGAILFDTGYSTYFYEATRKYPEKIYSFMTPVKIEAKENAGAQLDRIGYKPDQIKWIILSHFDPDHIGGLRDFPNARIVCSWRAWREIAGKKGMAALRERLLTDLLPNDLEARLLLLPDPDGPPIGPLGSSLDLFGDGAVRLVSLPGHASGMLGALITTEAKEQIFLCADACWTVRTIETKNSSLGVHRFLAKNRHEQEETYQKLFRFRDELPDVHVVPSHCPIAAKRFLK